MDARVDPPWPRGCARGTMAGRHGPTIARGVQRMPASAGSQTRNMQVSKQAVDDAFKALCNWGRWGKDDQIGTLNHVTPAAIVAAAGLIRRGKVFALGI